MSPLPRLTLDLPSPALRGHPAVRLQLEESLPELDVRDKNFQRSEFWREALTSIRRCVQRGGHGLEVGSVSRLMGGPLWLGVTLRGAPPPSF